MTQSMILCEGGSDLALIQYFMEVAHGWNHKKAPKKWIESIKNEKHFSKENQILMIGEVGGCSKLNHYFEKLIKKNVYSTNDEDLTHNIVIISDRDEIETLDDFQQSLTEILTRHHINVLNLIENNSWIHCESRNGQNQVIKFRVLLLIIPFEETGALETFLLNAISKNNTYDKEVIEKVNQFVDEIDPQRRYLNKRRLITKAKFDVYFSVRTAANQFAERQNVLKNVPWEEYEVIQQSFKKLKEL